MSARPTTRRQELETLQRIPARARGCDYRDASMGEPVFANVLCETLTQHKVSEVALTRRLGHLDNHPHLPSATARRFVFGWCNGTRLPDRELLVVIADCLRLTGNDRARLFAARGLWPDEWDLP